MVIFSFDITTKFDDILNQIRISWIEDESMRMFSILLLCEIQQIPNSAAQRSFAFPSVLFALSSAPFLMNNLTMFEWPEAKRNQR